MEDLSGGRGAKTQYYRASGVWTPAVEAEPHVVMFWLLAGNLGEIWLWLDQISGLAIG
jgi:hypothetical protein